MLFLFWELLGVISYLLINYWSNKINNGIKSIIFNKLGDYFLLLLISINYSLISINFNYLMVNHSILNLCYYYCINLSLINPTLIVICLLLIVYSKSAQLPFCSWLLNAISAPTPISALLHSSTLVIAGVYINIIIDDLFILLSDYYSIVYLLLFNIPFVTLIWSLFKSLIVNDIKSIIALSTISQLSYMFIILALNPILSLVHIIIHSLFKSLLFIVCGSIIHINLNYQLINYVKLPFNSFILIWVIFNVMVLIIAISKEMIIIALFNGLIGYFYFFVVVVGGLFSLLYSVRLYVYCFWLLLY